MARGQSAAADNQLNKTNAVGDSEQGKANALESKLIPGYSSLMDTGYLSPEEENAANVSEMGAAAQPFESMQFNAANKAAATNNGASLADQQDELASRQGDAESVAAAGLQREKMGNQEAGMYGLGQLKAQDQGEAAGMYGLGPGTLNARAAGMSGDQIGLGYFSAATGGASSAYAGRNG